MTYKVNQKILSINAELAGFERELIKKYSKNESIPPIFILGAPRSGTTLIEQVIISAFEIAYIDNIVAKFWEAPATGISLSNDIISFSKREIKSFTSKFGFTDEVTGPHEFGYFWQKWFQFEDTNELSPADFENVNKKELKQQVYTMNNVIKLPVIFKNPASLTLQAKFLTEIFPDAIFIFCFRDPIFNAQSIILSRIKYYGSVDQWFSTKPQNYSELVKMGIAGQVIAQLKTCNSAINSAISNLKAKGLNNYMILNYEEFCRSPERSIEKINKVFEKKQMNVKRKGRTFTPFKNTNELKIDRKLFNELEKLINAK